MKNIMCTKKGDKSGRVIQANFSVKNKKKFENLNNMGLRKPKKLKRPD